MRGGRNKFGPMYKRDRALKQQAIRQRQLVHCQFQMDSLSPGMPGMGCGMDFDSSQDIKPDVTQLMEEMQRSANTGMLSMATSQNTGAMDSHPGSHSKPPLTSHSSHVSPRPPPHPHHSPRSYHPTHTSQRPHHPHKPHSDYQHPVGGYAFPPNPMYGSSHGSLTFRQPPLPPPPAQPSVPPLIRDLQNNEISAAEEEQRLRCVTEADMMIVSELGLLANSPDVPHAANSAINKQLLKTFCKMCDQKLFLMVEWARKAHFFKQLKVSLTNMLRSGQNGLHFADNF